MRCSGSRRRRHPPRRGRGTARAADRRDRSPASGSDGRRPRSARRARHARAGSRVDRPPRCHGRRRSRARRPPPRGRPGRADRRVLAAVRAIAFADHGSSSQSSTSQPVPSSSHRPAASTAARTRLSTASVSARSSRKGRPVRVYMAPVSPVSTPKRSWATSASRQTTAIARDPMCFSSQITVGTPCEGYSRRPRSGARAGRGDRMSRSATWPAAGTRASAGRGRTGP